MIRDAIYDLVARNRCCRFGRRDAYPAEIRIIRGHRETLRNCGMAPGAGRHDEGSSVTAIQLSPIRRRAHGDHPNEGNLIGYSYRKLGDSNFSHVWYERALKSDPNHVLTWQYYGLWQIEQGNRDQAQDNAERPGIAAGPFPCFLALQVGLRNPYHPCRRYPQARRRLCSSSVPRPPWLQW